MRYWFLLFLQISLFCSDYDCILVGTSPFSLFEALYQSHSGKKVLILEEAAICGGAWKGINICGVMHADLGCHMIGCDPQLKSFLEEYAGCKIVSLDHPLLPFDFSKSPNGWYFSQGCYELIDHLLQLIAATDIVLLMQHKVDTVNVNQAEKKATVYTNNGIFTTDKLILTPMSTLQLMPTSFPQQFGKSKHYHLYLLIQDPTPPKFSYRGGGALGFARMMNLTHFVQLTHSGRQLIVVQTYNENLLSDPELILADLKKNEWVDPSAYLLQAEPYIYETGHFHQGLIKQIGAGEVIEVLQTGHIQNLKNYISKWKGAIQPFEISRNLRDCR
jgi:hypothetical protein